MNRLVKQVIQRCDYVNMFLIMNIVLNNKDIDIDLDHFLMFVFEHLIRHGPVEVIVQFFDYPEQSPTMDKHAKKIIKYGRLDVLKHIRKYIIMGVMFNFEHLCDAAWYGQIYIFEYILGQLTEKDIAEAPKYDIMVNAIKVVVFQ
jgi:hypothetical protein